MSSKTFTIKGSLGSNVVLMILPLALFAYLVYRLGLDMFSSGINSGDVTLLGVVVLFITGIVFVVSSASKARIEIIGDMLHIVAKRPRTDAKVNLADIERVVIARAGYMAKQAQQSDDPGLAEGLERGWIIDSKKSVRAFGAPAVSQMLGFWMYVKQKTAPSITFSIEIFKEGDFMRLADELQKRGVSVEIHKERFSS